MQTSHGEIIIVEVLDRFGKIRQRDIIREFPCRIGRAYSNDIILDDPYISPHHLELDYVESGPSAHFVARDLESDNGMFTVHPLRRHETVQLDDNTRLRIGHTDIRFRLPSHSIEETVTERNKPSKLMMLFTNALMFPVVWAALLAVFVLDNYLSSVEQVTFNTQLKVILPVLVFVTLWAVSWSVVSKIVTHHFYFALHAIWIGLLILVSYLAELAFAFVEFGFSMSGAQSTLTTLLDLILMSILFYGHLRYSTTVSRYNARRLGILAAVVITAFLQLNELADKVDFSNRPEYSNILKPPMFVLTEPASTDDYLQQTVALKFDWDNADNDEK